MKDEHDKKFFDKLMNPQSLQDIIDTSPSDITSIINKEIVQPVYKQNPEIINKQKERRKVWEAKHGQQLAERKEKLKQDAKNHFQKLYKARLDQIDKNMK